MLHDICFSSVVVSLNKVFNTPGVNREVLLLDRKSTLCFCLFVCFQTVIECFFVFSVFQDSVNALAHDLNYPALRKNKNIEAFLNRCKSSVCLVKVKIHVVGFTKYL